MKKFLKLFVESMPFTFGMIITLTSLCFLVKFYDYGFHFSEDIEFLYFVVLFVIGFPLLIFGINKLSKS